MNIDIIGAGICGLTTALALEKKGYKPTIYEQAKTLKPVGAGIMLASNAMQVCRKLGLENQIKQHGIVLDRLNITDTKLKKISKINLEYFKKTYNLQSIAIHRGKLQQVLLHNLNHTNIHFDHKLKTMSEKTDGYLVNFENGKSINSCILLGADGIHSKVRNAIVPNSKIRNTNQVCWRGVTQFNIPNRYKNELNEAWGKSSRFAFVEINEDQIYWYAVKSFKKNSDEFSIEKLTHYYKDYHPVITEIINTTPLQSIHTSIMEDLKPINIWHDNYTCLIGDAAHATTPNMGQGACQSIEDAYIISECLEKYESPKAFAEYQKLRMPNAHKVVNQSWTIGKISHWKNPILTSIRNKLMSITPEKMNRLQLEKIFQLEKQH